MQEVYTMKKLIAWALVLAMILSVMPVSVLAEGEKAIPVAHSHSASQHKCEHCGESVTWTAWSRADSLPTDAGHYYLTTDVKISAQSKLTGTTDQVMCLNGYTINGNAKLAWYLQDTAKLTVTDCTAYTDADGMLHAGTVQNCKQAGAMGAAIYAKNGASLAIYNTIFTNNTLTKNTNSVEGRGGTIQMRGDAANKTVTLYMENCWFEDNNIGQSAGAVNVITTTSTATAKATIKGSTFKGNSALQGGAAYLNKAEVIFESCSFEGNTAEQGGAIYAKSSDVTMSKCTVKGNTATTEAIVYAESSALEATECTFTENAAVNGAAIYAKTCTKLTMTKCTVSKNTLTKGAALHVNKTPALVDGCTFEANVAAGSTGSAIQIHGSGGDLTLKDSLFKDNVCTDKSANYRGAVYLTNPSDDLTLMGAVVFEGNYKHDADGNQLSTAIYVQDNPNPIDIGGLTEGAKVSVETRSYTAADADDIFQAATAPTTWDNSWVMYANLEQYVGYNETDKFFFTELTEPEPVSDHKHCVCGVETCTEHEMVEYLKWEQTDALPTSGYYYLTADVNLAAEASVSENLHLCLNGHDVKAAAGKRHLSTVSGAGVTVVISDCTAAYDAEGNYTAGKFYGGQDKSGNAGGGSLYMRKNNTLKLYDGIVCDNTTIYKGGGIYIYDNAVFEMYDGLIENNTAVTADGKTWKAGGNINAGKSRVCIYGGTIRNGKAANGAGIYGSDSSTITISGGTICGNHTTKDGCGVYVKDSVLTITGGTFCHNDTDSAGSAICFGSNSTGSVENAIVEANTGSSGGGFMIQNGAVATMKNVTIRNNTITGSGGAIRLYNAELTMSGCTITGNTAKNGGGINVESGAVLTVENSTIRNNTATAQTGGLNISANSQLTLKGNPVIAENEGGNLVLVGGTLMDVSNMTGGEIFITADMGPISKPCSDLSQYFKSESVYRGIVYRDGALYMATDGSHKHCFCFGSDAGCDHEIVEWVAWEATDSLPASGSYYLLNDIVLAEEQSITNDVNICLNGHTVKAADGKRHISTVKDTNVTIVISDCTAKTENGVYTAGKFYGGVDTSGNSGGGAIYLRTPSTLNFYDGILTGNTSTTMGGAIFLNQKATLNFYNGLIENNTAVSADGTAWMPGGGIAAYVANVNIYGGIITGNQGSNGGGVYGTSRVKVTVNGGTISNNYGHQYGGGIYVTGSTVDIKGGTVTGNTAVTAGGGMYLSTESSGTMTGGTFSGNTSSQGGAIVLSGESKLDISGGKVADNVATSSGGGFALYSKSQLQISGGTISGNTCKTNGGAIYNSAAYVTVTGGTITKNYGMKDGGAFYVKNGNIDVSGEAVFTSNTTDVNGGAISYGTNSTGTVSGGTFRSNKAAGGGALMVQNGADVKITGGIFQSNTSTSARGGAVRVYKAKLAVSGGTFEKNKAAKSSGGAIGATNDSTLTVTGGVIKNNTAKLNAGAIALSSNSNATLSNVTITGNTGDKDGGGIYINKGRLDVRENVVMSGNTTKVNGGAISYGSGSSGYVSGLTAYGNHANNGAGLMIQGKAEVTIGYASITNNVSKKYAGGIYLHKASLNMTGGYIANNSCKSIGGGIYTDTAVSLKLSNVKITNNQAKNGGATYLKNTSATFNNVQILENEASNLGGGMYFTGGANWGKLYPSVLTNVKIIGNTADGEASKGGGIYVNTDLELTCIDCQISDNYTTQYGGGVYAPNGAKLTMNGCTVTDNSSLEIGGGLYILDCGELTNTVISGNKSDKGAGIYAGNQYERYHVNGFGSKGDNIGLLIKDCTIEGNDAKTDGGGLHLDMSCYTTIHNTVFTGNTAGQKGSAMWLWENCTMTDLTVTDNVCANNGYALYLADSEFDGQTYINGLFKMGGNMIVKDNEGGDLFLDNKVTIGNLPDGYGPKTEMNVTLDAGYLTQRILGYYNYEGGNLQYVLTYGDRSMTDPEFDPSMVVKPVTSEQTESKTSAGDIALYAGIGVIALVAIAGAVLLVKKKKSAKAETK